ncbi:DNA polymerase sliding clamp (plasmid) [Halorutilales archaeon Cl-col2-1]
MFEASINAGVLQSGLDTVENLVDECKVRLKEDELSIQAVDPANVGMVDLSIPAESFESYNGDNEVIGLNIERFMDIIGMANKDDTIDLELDPETHKLKIHVEGLHYTLSLIDADAVRQEPDVPDLDLSSEVVVAGRQIDRGVKASGMVSDHLELGVNGNFYMHAEGDTDDVRIDLDEEEVVDLEGDDARSMFSLDYLEDMSKAIPKDAQVRMELGIDHPTKMHFDVGDGSADVTYLLAPRIENE